jgi:hypothetical protein
MIDSIGHAAQQRVAVLAVGGHDVPSRSSAPASTPAATASSPM